MRSSFLRGRAWLHAARREERRELTPVSAVGSPPCLSLKVAYVNRWPQRSRQLVMTTSRTPQRTRVVAALTAAVVAGLASPLASASATAAPDAVAAQSALLAAFKDHSIVALGQAHELRQEDEFIVDLLRHPGFAATVDSIVVEFGNARYQKRADRYVAGGHVPLRALRQIWRDAIGSAPDGVVDESPARFFAAVRRLNQTLAAADRVRVALGDPAFDFRKLRHRRDIYRAGGRRDQVFAAVAEREARSGRHVLLLSGYMHLVRVPLRPFGPNALRILERGQPHRVHVVVPYAGIGARGQDDFESRHVPAAAQSVLRPLTGALGAEPADRILPDVSEPKPGAKPPADPYPGLQLSAVADELITFGRCSDLRTTRFSQAQWRDPAYRAELNRRSQILSGHRFVPPPASFSNAPYCELVRGQSSQP